MEANATESTVDATRNATNDPNPFSDFKNIIIAAVLLIIIIGKITLLGKHFINSCERFATLQPVI